MSPTLSNSFLSRVVNSQLVPEEQLSRCLAAAGDDEELLADQLLRDGLLTRFQVRQLRAGSQSLTVGNYIAVDYLGRGGSGIVLKAYHKLMPDRFVAIKTIDTRSLHSSEEVAARFRREIQIVSKLDHPNVVRALDVIQTRNHLYLVLEHIDGPDLGKLVQQSGPLPVGRAVDYAIQVARGLAYAHQQGVVHRDLKPTNLLIAPSDVIKITDMGLARPFGEEGNSNLTMKGLAIGTPEYMSPEQAEDARTADPRSDLYSLGATLFFLLTGTPTVQGSSFFFKMKNLLTGPVIPLAEMRSDVPADLAAVVDRLRARKPEDRPQTAEETIALLEPFSPSRETRRDIKLPSREISDLVLEVLRGQKTAAQVCQLYGWTPADFEGLQKRFIDGGRRALNSDPDSDHALQKLHAKIGAQQMEIEELKRRQRR
jgi:eukaryotic-like serine/threonine-protein kinase